LKKTFEKEKVDIVVHLAAQAGVRYSLINPFVYQKTNVLGTLNLLELARKYKIKKFIFASSSSVYGNNEKVPFSENDKVNNPASLYGATKIAGEAICKSYHSLYKIPICILRFFTVYGPWGRPDMAYFKFTKAILENKKIDVYNFGKMSRDFTYIDDIVDGVLKAMKYDFKFEIFNLGNNKPVDLLYFIKVIEKAVGKKAKKQMVGMQKGDVRRTWADIKKAKKLLSWQPETNIEEGIGKFVEWHRKYYKVD
jgi:UDP-glucuronate 4-epimerase